jgi:SAM-dependent methyltransferase
MVAERNEYTRQRIEPQLMDIHYIPLSDLLLCVRAHASDEAIRILDYGAGISPYRQFFPNATYEKADIADLAGVDYVLRGDGSVPAPSEAFDLVISTQVLEHVPDPIAYLSECERVLRPGGFLMLSTHGIFEDHGCPYDFRRWTADGLRHDLILAGFQVDQLCKLSSGGRAIVYLLERWAGTSSEGPGRMFSRFLTTRVRRILHGRCDRLFPDCRIVDDGLSGHVLYICLFALARKTSRPAT